MSTPPTQDLSATPTPEKEWSRESPDSDSGFATRSGIPAQVMKASHNYIIYTGYDFICTRVHGQPFDHQLTVDGQLAARQQHRQDPSAAESHSLPHVFLLFFIRIGNFWVECPQISDFDLAFQPQDMHVVGRIRCRHLSIPRGFKEGGVDSLPPLPAR